MDLERKSVDLQEFEVKDGAEGYGRLVGYASLFDVVDRQNDSVGKGAFKNLSDFARDGFIAINHDHNSVPIATVDVARDDGKGVWLEIDFHSHPVAQMARQWALERKQRNKSVAMSIGYTVNKDGYEYDEKGVRLLKSLQLFEVSLVNIPALPSALVAGVKGLGDSLGFAEHLDAVVDAASDLAERAKARVELREKAGRTLSAANIEKIRAVMAALQEFLGLTEGEVSEEAVPPGERAVEEQKAEETTLRPRRPKTIARYRRRLAEYERWATAEGILKFEPAEEEPAIQRRKVSV